MALSDFEQERREVKRKGAVLFTVRGLNLEDLTALVIKNLPQIEEAFVLYAKSKTEIFTSKSLDKFVVNLAGASPDLIAEVISVAADEPQAVDKAKKLPFALQVSALTDIVNLTFEEVGSLKNLFATLAENVKANVDPDALLSLRSQIEERLSKPSTGDSAETLVS